MRVSIASALVASSAIVAGCASPYSRFYQPSEGATAESIATSRAAPAPAQPVVERVDRAEPGAGPAALSRRDYLGKPPPVQPVDEQASQAELEAVLADYSRRGYLAIGQSAFDWSQAVPESAAIAQGKRVGADLVLIFSPVATGWTLSNVAYAGPGTAEMPVPHFDFRAVYFVKLR